MMVQLIHFSNLAQSRCTFEMDFIKTIFNLLAVGTPPQPQSKLVRHHYKTNTQQSGLLFHLFVLKQ